MKKKMRKFSEGGFETAVGENPNISEDTRSKAMKFVENASEESRDIGAPVTRSAAKTSSKISQTVAPAKPKIDMAAVADKSCHHLPTSKSFCASVSMVPHETPSTGTPNPRKDKITSALMQETVRREN